MHNTLARHEIVLLGVGHTNAHVLRMWKMSPIPEARLTCISDHAIATYSGMLPAVLAGQYARERMEIDLVRLCASAGARLIVGDVEGVDADNRIVKLNDRPDIPFDVLSIGIGSIPKTGDYDLDSSVVPIKPMQTFLSRLDARLGHLETESKHSVKVVVVGAGPGGIEVAFCLPNRLRQAIRTSFQITLVTGSTELGSFALADSTRRLVSRHLEEQQIAVLTGRRVVRVANGRVEMDDGSHIDADVVLWSTSAVPSPLLDRVPVERDSAGFLATRPTLQTSNDAIFAVGDAGTLKDTPTAKAGVYAVRQGPVLWGNLQRFLAKRDLKAYRPQPRFLKLLNTGDGKAIAEYGRVAAYGRTWWNLKDRIDSRFMAMYQDYRAMEMDMGDASQPPPMRCAGCGGKVSGSVLSRVLARLDIPANDNVLLGLEQPDDAAIVQAPNGRPMAVTADFFSSPFDDAYLVGRIAALNSLSDALVLGADPIAALALVTLPVGRPRHQEQLLYELLSGSLEELRAVGATLAGGHTIEGPQVTIGFTVLADQRNPASTKSNLGTNENLILTKPLGTGVLLAAHMRAECRADWFDPLVRSMLHSNQRATSIALESHVTAMTDVTGFGLAGHLLEMLEASNVDCEIRGDALPLLPGAAELISAGLESTLAPANRAAEAAIEISEPQRREPWFDAIFDPQTHGGLLLSVPDDHLDEVLGHLNDATAEPGLVATVIGRTCERTGSMQRIRFARAGVAQRSLARQS